MNNEYKHIIYLPSDCISEKMLFDYIDNKLNQKERHIVEKHLLDCELCSDALEGLELVKDRTKIAQIKEAITKRFVFLNSAQHDKKEDAIVVSFNYKIAFSIAATIALLVVGVFLFKTINNKDASISGLAELKKEENTQSPPPAPPSAPMDEANNTVTETVSGATAAAGKAVNQATREEVADQEIAFAEDQKKPDIGYYKKSGSGDASGTKNEQSPVQNANGATVLNDAIASTDDRKENNLETISIPKTSGNERDKDGKLDDTKKAEEKTIATATGGTTYAWQTTTTSEKNKNQKTDTDGTYGKSEGQIELAKKSDVPEKNRAQSRSKDKVTTKAEDVTIEANVAYEPQSISQTSDELKSETSQNTTPMVITSATDSTETVFKIAEEMPEYPGGTVEMNKFIDVNFLGGKKVEKGNVITTKIIVQFTVGKDGSILDPKIIKGATPELNKEALRVVKMMPKWKPGKQNGMPVSVTYSVSFQQKTK